MDRVWRTRTNTVATTTHLRRKTLSIASNRNSRTSHHENRKNPQALPDRGRKTLPTEGSRSRRHARTEIGGQTGGARVAHKRRGGACALAGRSGRPESVGTAAGLPGHGRGRQGWNYQTRDVRRESAGGPGDLVQSALHRGTGPRLLMADHETFSRARRHRHL